MPNSNTVSSHNSRASLIFFSLGNPVDKLGRLDEATSSYDRAISLGERSANELKPDDHEAWDNRGIALVNLGRLDEAIFSHSRALLIQPQYSSAIYNLACCHARQGNIDKLIDYLQQAVQLNPSHYINLARQNDDFQLLRNEPRFIALLNSGV